MKSPQILTQQFAELFKNTPGVLSIETGIKGYVVVFIDRDKLEEIIPTRFGNINVVSMDVKYIRDNSIKMLKHPPDYPLQLNAKTKKLFERTIELCKRIGM